MSWEKKFPYAYWKGNPDVNSRVREELIMCNDTNKWGAQILRQVHIWLNNLYIYFLLLCEILKCLLIFSDLTFHHRIGHRK